MKLKKVNVSGVFLLSGKLGVGTERLAEFIYQANGGRNVFVVGHANVGKSTLTNLLTRQILRRTLAISRKRRDMRRKDMVAAEMATISALPGTTLMSRRIPIFNSYKHALYDTPGLFPSSRYPWPVPPVYR